MEKQVVNLTIFLIKEHITDLKDCLKAPDTLSSSNIKHEYGMEGTIFYCDSKRKPPRWKAYLETLSERSLDISDNASNKAILLVRIEHVEGTSFAICSIYSALVFQTEYEGQNYILCAGTWYQVETSFFNQVNNFIRTRVTISDIVLPNCPKGKHEGDYNEQVASADANLCLMDKKLVSVEGGPKQIEACDLFSKDKKFIHVKNKGQSAQLSHLFSQGKVSAECFASDEKYRKQVSDLVIAKFGDTIFDYTAKPQSNEFEVVYAIIDEKESSLEDKLPFFSKVNLMLAVQELDRMHFSCSVCLVKKET